MPVHMTETELGVNPWGWGESWGWAAGAVGGGGGVTVIPFGLSTFDTCASDRVIQWYLIDRHGRRVWVMVKWHGKGAGYGVKGKGGAGNGTQGPLVGGGGADATTAA